MPQVLLHSFRMSDVDDPYLYAAFPISEWQKTEHGKWCMENAQGEPTFYCNADPNSWGFRVTIMGELSEPNITFLKLKWGR
jgi:hypothetical protein